MARAAAARGFSFLGFDLNARQTPPFRAGKDSADAEGIHSAPSKAFVAARCSIKKIARVNIS
jgi:hypothetical protein